MLVDAAVGHKVISFMDGNTGYSQIFMTEEDIHKTAFRCPGALGLYEWVVMTFGLKNASATYQRAMSYIFYELIGKIVEIYIDDVVIKSKGYQEHLKDLRATLECARKHGLRMNPHKCVFSVSSQQFLGFMVHDKGNELGQKSSNAISKTIPPTSKTELQSLIDKFNLVRRFVSNLSAKILSFSALLKLKNDQEFKWGNKQQKTFEEIKEYMKSPLVLIPPQMGKPFKLYVAIGDHTIGLALMQEFGGKERVIFYLNKSLLDLEIGYSPIEKLCLCLYFSCTKLRHYLLSSECIVVSKFDMIKHMLSMPILNGRIGKWILAFLEFDLKYESAKAVKGQIIADFITHHHEKEITLLKLTPWALFFYGSTCKQGGGIGIVLISP